MEIWTLECDMELAMKEGTVLQELYCPPKLLSAVVRLIHSIWSERKITAMASIGHR